MRISKVVRAEVAERACVMMDVARLGGEKGGVDGDVEGK